MALFSKVALSILSIIMSILGEYDMRVVNEQYLGFLNLALQ